MKKIRETFVRAARSGALRGLLAGAFAAASATTGPAAHAAVLPLQGAVITATYNGSGAAMLGLDHGFAAEPGSNTSGLDASGAGVEFFTADALFGFDFGADGSLVIYNNAPIPAGSYGFRFDFANLAAPLTGFTVGGMAGASGAPVLALLDGGRALALDLGAVAWNDGFGTITAQASAQANTVPEPRSAALLLAGLCAWTLARRRHAN